MIFDRVRCLPDKFEAFNIALLCSHCLIRK